MSRDSESDWEQAIVAGGVIWLLWKWSNAGDAAKAALHRAFEPSLPSGVRLPEYGDLREVPRERTALDAHGFPELYNRALQIVEDAGAFPGEHRIADFLRARDIVSLSFGAPDVDAEYDVPARIFAAQAAVETDNGRACFNYNTGNVTVARGDYYRNPGAEAKEGGVVLRFGNYNFPLQGAVAHVDRIKRLWPDAYRAAYSGAVDAFAHGLQDGERKYAGSVSADALASAIRSRSQALGYT